MGFLRARVDTVFDYSAARRIIMAVSIAALEILEAAQFAPIHARAIAKAIEVAAEEDREQLVTRSVLAQALASLREELKADIAVLRQEIALLRQDMALLRQEMAQGIALLRQELLELKAEVHRCIGELAFRIYLAILAQIAVTLGGVYFLLSNVR
jgi:hypothetical protein